VASRLTDVPAPVRRGVEGAITAAAGRPVAVLAATPAFAHPGHVAEISGHSHWLALAFFSLAVAIGGFALWRHVRERRATEARKAESSRA